uniref:F-box domain-containing protein n=1 Tax=Aegilops tauschii TaxID=37682 RepID=M8D4A1_AEGTA
MEMECATRRRRAMAMAAKEEEGVAQSDSDWRESPTAHRRMTWLHVSRLRRSPPSDGDRFRRQRGHGGGTDLIGDLPDEMLLLVLAGLSCIRTTVRTGLLSRRWRGLWTSLAHMGLVFHDVAPTTVKAALARFAASPPASVGVHRLHPPSKPLRLPQTSTTSVELDAAFMRVKPAPMGDFTALERLSLKGKIDNLGAVLDRCPCLRVLAVAFRLVDSALVESALAWIQVMRPRLTVSLLDISIPWKGIINAAGFASLIHAAARISPQEFIFSNFNQHINGCGVQSRVAAKDRGGGEVLLSDMAPVGSQSALRFHWIYLLLRRGPASSAASGQARGGVGARGEGGEEGNNAVRLTVQASGGEVGAGRSTCVTARSWQGASRSGQDDLISTLPDDMLIQILTRLGCAHAAACTDVLVRRWRSLWIHIPGLIFRDVPTGKVQAALTRVARRRAGMSVSALDIRLARSVPSEAARHDDALAKKLLRKAVRLSPEELIFVLPRSSISKPGRRVEIAMPCFLRATSIELDTYFLRIQPPDNQILPALERLSLSGNIVDMGACLN